MPISVVVGGQYGSEGKGKISHWLAEEQSAKYAVRVGGPNSGHTAISQSKSFALRQLPTPALLGNVVSVIPAGAYLNVDVLLREIEMLGVSKNDLLIHPDAVLIERWMCEEEVECNLTGRIASTGQGVGSAVAHRAFRNSEVQFAKNHDVLSMYVEENLNHVLAQAIENGERIIVEGTQGLGLSILHGGHYPYATSRDTSAAGALSEAGLGPTAVDCVVLVVRAFPIRVAGMSGPLPKETSWDSVTRLSGSTEELIERTTVTGKIRRIAEFDSTVVRNAIAVNCPTHICLNHIDYFDYSVHEQEFLTEKVNHFVTDLESQIGCPIDWIGTGPATTIKKQDKRALNATAA